MRTVSPMVVTKSRKPVTVFVTKLVFPVETIFFNHSSWVLEDSIDEVDVDVVVVSEESEGSSFVSTEEKMSKEKLKRQHNWSDSRTWEKIFSFVFGCD